MIFVGLEFILFFGNFYVFKVFARYLFKQLLDQDSYKDNILERGKLVSAMNFIIIKDFVNTIYLIIVMVISMGYLAIFAAPLPIFILVVKMGW